MVAIFSIVAADPARDTELHWHVGNGPIMIPDEAEIVDVLIDGDELDHVRETFTGLRMNTVSRSVEWRGDDARFLANNLGRR